MVGSNVSLQVSFPSLGNNFFLTVEHRLLFTTIIILNMSSDISSALDLEFAKSRVMIYLMISFKRVNGHHHEKRGTIVNVIVMSFKVKLILG